MTIDERLERLVERHEALTQTVELIALEQREFAKEQRELTKNNQTLNVLVREIAGGIRDLVTVVRSHEQRISHIEGSQ
jgi:prefoldin subunit 5